MDLTREEWKLVKAIITAARNLVRDEGCWYGDHKEKDAFALINAIKAFDAHEEKNRPERDALLEVAKETKALCDLIVNSPPDTVIKGKIESAAFFLGHHPYVINAK